MFAFLCFTSYSAYFVIRTTLYPFELHPTRSNFGSSQGTKGDITCLVVIKHEFDQKMIILNPNSQKLYWIVSNLQVISNFVNAATQWDER